MKRILYLFQRSQEVDGILLINEIISYFNCILSDYSETILDSKLI